MTSDADEYRELNRYRVIDQSVKHLRTMQLALHRVFGEVVKAAQWSEFSGHSIKSYTDPQEWDMISHNPQQLGQSILVRQKADVDHAALALGEALLKQTGSALIDTTPETLRDSPRELGRVEMSLEQISELLGHQPKDKIAVAVTSVKQGVMDMVNNNSGLSAQAAMSFGFKPGLADADEKKLNGKRQLLNVAQKWAELAMLETRVMRTALILDRALEKKGVAQERIVADYQGRVILSTPTQWQFVASDKQAFTGLGKARQTLHKALTH